MKILHITSILPAPLKRKKKENDILIRIAEEYQKEYSNSCHYFVLSVPYSNSILAAFKNRWKEYHELIRKGFYEYHGFKINVIGMPAFKSDQVIRKQLSHLGYLFNKKRIEKIISQVKPDLIHAHNFRGNIELAQLLKEKYNINYVVTVRNINKKIILKLNRDKYTPTKILAINYRLYRKCKQEIKTPVELIPHPVDNDFFVNPDSLIVNKTLKFISVCRLLNYKNLDKVLIALSKISKPFIYDIYGSGPEEENLKQLVNQLNLQEKVNFKGWVAHKKIKMVMKEYDLFLQLSYPETLGRVYFEAMASGVLIVAAKGTGVDGIIENGREGYLVSHKNIDRIYSSIIEFLNLTETKIIAMKKNAIDTASLYRWENTLKMYKKFYK